jgi:hypothetical protein
LSSYECKFSAVKKKKRKHFEEKKGGEVIPAFGKLR